ncbi:efflux transporter periplasmic adaptor subunit [Spiribacter halobius]|uniref:Efflux transporter periplasmic adaptor subunit n=2 Tax=Sediminicurvatus halobius TaxID=2182432 RepID=A0A2U2N0Y5_9GAMM|nr:efflux transporter periplasmic adaptor subunit [Spiribacter halobius]
MLSGQIAGDTGPATPASEAEAPVAVQVREMAAERVERELENQGDTVADQDVELRAQTAGRVAEVLVARGERVAAGDPILRLAMEDRAARRAEAEARVAQREADYEAAQRLGDDGFQAQTAVREARAALEAARAALAAIEEEIRHTTVRAPFDGVLEERPVEVGDFVAVGDPVARVVNADPLLAVINVAQQDIGRVRLGAEAVVELATGDRLEGVVSYISGAAQSGTRTFRVEVEAPNPDGLPAGVSATVRIPLESVQAHFVTPAVLALEESGQLGVKTVNEAGEVVFHPVNIVRAEREGVWVTGLPERARVITVGQGFVRAGEPVRAVAEAELPDDRTLPEPEAPPAALGDGD